MLRSDREASRPLGYRGSPVPGAPEEAAAGSQGRNQGEQVQAAAAVGSRRLRIAARRCLSQSPGRTRRSGLDWQEARRPATDRRRGVRDMKIESLRESEK